jgi:hypothetical protein
MNAWVSGYEVISTEERLAREIDRLSNEFARTQSRETWICLRRATAAYAEVAAS